VSEMCQLASFLSSEHSSRCRRLRAAHRREEASLAGC
jgi:hypothetical protein